MAEILVGLLIVLGIVTVVGHAIWWMFATIIKALLGSSSEPAKQRILLSNECAGCGASLKFDDDFCSVCGRPQKLSSHADPLAELTIVIRQMDRFLNLGKIDPATHQQVINVIEEERERLVTPMQPPQSVKPAIETFEPVKAAPIIKPEPDAVDPISPSILDSMTKAPESDQLLEPAFVAPPTFDWDAADRFKKESIQVPPEPPREPRRSFAEMLETFMEESSIRWGELIGGLLIIGCSLALVISLWSQITAVPVLKFSVFVGVTAGLFGIGFYSAHRWKLPTTSRGALTISTLLVPLNFLAMTAFSQSVDPNSAIIFSGEFVALVLFFFLVYQAAKVIAPGNSWLMAGATLLPSFSMLMAKHWQSSQVAIVWLAIAPLISYWLATGMMLRGSKGEDREGAASQIFLMLGIASFASLLPFALLLIKSGIFSVKAHSFATFITLFGVPAIACGLTLRAESDLSGRTKTAATSLALLGALLAFGGLALAWPRPLPLIVVALINCAVCGVIAWRLALKLAHGVAIGLFALAYLLGASVLWGGFPEWLEDSAQLIASFWTNNSGISLMTLFVLFCAVAEIWRKIGRRFESRLYEVSAIVSAFLSLLTLTWHGIGRAGDPQHLTLGYLFYAVAAFVIARHRNQFLASWAGLSLSLLTILQALAFRFGYPLAPYHPVRLSFLTFASLATIVAVFLRKRGENVRRVFVQPATLAALVSSIAVAPFVLFGGWMTLEQVTIRIFWLSAIWLTLAVMNCWPVLFTAFQTLLTIGVFCGVAAIFDARALPSHLSWRDPQRLQAQGIALTLLSLFWIAARLTFRRNDQEESLSNFQTLLFPSWFKVDQIVIVMVWGLMVALSFGGIEFREAPLSATGDFAVRARGFGSWLLLLALALVFFVSLWERFRKRLPMAMMTLLVCGCLLIAARSGVGSVLPTLRWLAAISFALVALPIILRNPLRRYCERFKWPQMDSGASGLASFARAESLAFFAVPVLVLTAVLVSTRWSEPSSLSATLTFLLPMLIVSVILAVHAIRERSAIYAFSSGLILNLAVTLGYFLRADQGLITVLQINVITFATVSLLWLEGRRRLAKNDDTKRSVSSLLRFQVLITLLICLVILIFADVRIIVDPINDSETVAAIGNGWGWLAAILSVAAWLNLRKERFGERFKRLNIHHFGVALLASMSLGVSSLDRIVDGWASYHALLISIGGLAWLVFAIRRYRLNWLKEGAPTAVGWAIGLSLAQFVLTLRGMEALNSIWWTIVSLAGLSLLYGWMAIVLQHRGYVYLSALLLNLIASLLFARHWDVLDKLPEFLAVNVIVLSISSLIWLFLNLKLMRLAVSSYFFHRQTIFVTLPTILLLSGFHWWARLIGQDWGAVWLNWAAVLSTAILLAAYLWEENGLASLRGLYLIGWIITLEGICLLPFKGQALLSASLIIWSFYVLAISSMWRKRVSLARLAEYLGMSQSPAIATSLWNWLLVWNSLLTALILMCSIEIVFSVPSLLQRVCVTTAAFALPASFVLIVRNQQDQRLITTTLRLCLLNVVLWSWAWLSPATLVGWQIVNRLVIVMLIVEVVMITYRLVIMRQVTEESLWRKSLSADLPSLALIGLVLLTVVLVIEFEQFVSTGAVLIGWPAIGAILVTLIGVSLIGIAFAVLPGEDPFKLDDRGRMRYVYASEAFLILTFAHLRLAMPWIFGGAFSAYWPILVMVLAFAGVGLAELFQRQGRLVLAEPLGKTGILLPLLPVIGFWSLNSDVPYSALLLLVGLFYGVLSVLRRSFTFGVLAALAGNAGLWHFLNGVGGLAFHQHPQLWLIPAALSVLLAARINRDSLSADQMNSIRYSALVTVYASSTADIFLNGVTDSPWLPIVLAVLAVCGVIAGLMLRIRAFLFLGTAFLLLSMLTMIWSASVNLRWTWLWYVTGIGLGILIIYTVAMFERKREQMLGFLVRLKQWQ
ncbi:MAG TPA: hypothetical protein PLK30_03700 [Blastocatellia bacterium]|nr:hypothetical protein [Blastocatellia bacterium]